MKSDIDIYARWKWCTDNISGRYSPEGFRVVIDGDRLVIYGDIIIYDNFEELPYEAFIDEVFGDVYISNSISNKRGILKSLKNMPAIIHGSFCCCNNPELTTLEGGPDAVDECYNAHHCGLTNLKGIAKSADIIKVYANKLTDIEDINGVRFNLIDVEFNDKLSLSSSVMKELLENHKVQI